MGLNALLLKRAHKQGELHFYVIGSWPRVRMSDVYAWLDSQAPPASRPPAAGGRRSAGAGSWRRTVTGGNRARRSWSGDQKFEATGDWRLLVARLDPDQLPLPLETPEAARAGPSVCCPQPALGAENVAMRFNDDADRTP